MALSSASFVSTQGTQFILDGHPFFINGFNSYFLMAISVDSYSRPRATALLEEAAAAGLNVCRTWAFNDGSGYEALQTSPGVYDEKVFQALDFVLSEANRVGVRLILSFCNNWHDYGGKAQYVQWARDGGVQLNSEDAFFSDPTVKGFYKNHIETIMRRVNTITGVAYKDDPIIFSWELMNEPRCESDPSGNSFQAWIEEIAPYVKSIDANHLLQVGLEGFYGPWSSSRLPSNPNSYCQQLGTDFVRNHQVSHIDYTSVHAYPDAWLGYNSTIQQQVSFMQAWIAAHVADCSLHFLQKPVLFSEFGISDRYAGFSVGNRDMLLATTYSTVLASASSGGPGAGALVWQLFPEGMEQWNDGYQIVLSRDKSTASVIEDQSQKVAALNAATPSPN